MKRIRWISTVALAIAVSAGVGYGQEGQDRTLPTSPPAAPAGNSTEFVTQMLLAGIAEVQLGRMATQQSLDPDVKAFGQMMVKDHSQATMELAHIATQLNVNPPAQLDQKHQELADRLSKLDGTEFDREYLKAMVQGHEEVLGMLQAQAGNHLTMNTSTSEPGAVGTSGVDDREPSLMQWVAKAIPTVQGHLERARSILQGTGK